MNRYTSLFSLSILVSSFALSAPTDYQTFFTSRIKNVCPEVKKGVYLGSEQYSPCEMIYHALSEAAGGRAEAWLENYDREFATDFNLLGDIEGLFRNTIKMRETAKQPESLCIAIERLGEQHGWTQEIVEEEMNQMLKVRSSLIPGSNSKKFMASLIAFFDNITPDTYAKFQRRKKA